MNIPKLLSALLFPPRCPGCGQLLPAVPLLCSGREVPLFCEECARVFREETAVACARCTNPVSACICQPKELAAAGCRGSAKLFYYYPGRRTFCTSRVIFAQKERMTGRLCRGLAAEAVPLVRQICRQNGLGPGDVYLTYLPRRAASLAKFGYDQAEMTAREIARQAAIPFGTLIKRSRHASQRAQKALSYDERFSHAGTAFRATGAELPRETKMILLYDDIITTGAGMTAGTVLLSAQYGLPVFAVSLGVTYERKKTEIKE